MITRRRIENLKPKVWLTVASDVEPRTITDALVSPQWKLAMQEEYDALLRNNTWSLVDKPLDKNIVGCKRVFKVKRNADGSVQRYKARLVAKGYNQIPSFDFQETFSSAIKPTTRRVVLTLALAKNWSLRQMDISNAFLHEDLLEEVFMHQPEGFVQTSFKNKVCKLHKALYGLKQAPKAWFQKLRNALLGFHFIPCKSNFLLYIKHYGSHTMLVLVYVDDNIITGSYDNDIKVLMSCLGTHFAIKDLGPLSYFLGVQVQKTNKGIHFSQPKYIKDLMVKASMDKCKPIATPMVSSTQLLAYAGSANVDPHQYRSIVGALQYVPITRPELAYSVNKLCQFMHHPLDSYWKASRRVLRYLQGTTASSLHLEASSQLNLKAFSDVDWASCLDDRKSTSGFCIFMGPNLVSWSAKKQHVVSRSSTEAEYRSLTSATAKICWFRSLFCELRLPQSLSPILCRDNLSIIALARNFVLHAQTKHVEIDLYFFRDMVEAGSLVLQHVPSIDQIADLLTKPISSSRFNILRSKLTVAPPT